MRFCQELIVMSADIEAMLNQVAVKPICIAVCMENTGGQGGRVGTSLVLSVPRHVLIMHCDEQLKTIRIPFLLQWK